MRSKLFLSLTTFLILFAETPSLLLGHVWTDKSGHYQVEAELVSANHELVVLRTADHRLIALDIVQLSDADQVLVRTKFGNSVKSALSTKAKSTFSPLPNSPLIEESPTPQSLDKRLDRPAVIPSADQRDETTLGNWTLVDGQRIKGDFVGFDLKPLTIKRSKADVYVGGVLFSQLDPVYQHILPMTIAHLEKANIEDVRDIDAWLKKSGPGPWTYKIEAVMIETPSRGSVAIPTFLLEKSIAEAISIPLRRWREALSSEISDEDRNSYYDREKFLTRASMVARDADASVEQQARYMRLDLLAVASGATDLWNVSLIPKSAYGYPYHVLVPGQNSDQARAAALLRYPSYTVAGIAKYSR